MHLNVVKSCLYALKWATWSLKRISHFQIPQGYIFYTTKEILNHSNKTFFTSNVPYTLKYLKSNILHLKKNLKKVKSLK